MMDYGFGYPNPQEEEQLLDPYAPTTDFGRVSMGYAPETQAAVQEQADAATLLNQANFDAADELGATVQEAQVTSPTAFQYTSQGATDNEALGEGMFAFGLAMLAASSKPGADFGASLAEGLGAGSKTFFSALNRNKRFENRTALEEKGFTQESIDAYIQSGDNKALVKNPVQNFMKTKELNGVMYEYDERNPAGTMKEITRGPKQVKGSVDLGNKVLIHYTDGTTEERDKGLTPGAAARGSGSGSGGKPAKPKWTEGLVEYKDPETGAMKVMTVQYDANTDPAERQYLDIQGKPLVMPEGGRFTSETQQRLRSEARGKAESSTGALGTGVAGVVQNINNLNSNAVHLLSPSRFVPYSEAWNKSNAADVAKSALMVQQYSTMPGVAGASVQTEEALIKAIPDKFTSEEGIAEWSLTRLEYDKSVIKATIRQQERQYDYVDPALEDALKSIENAEANLRVKLIDLRKPKEKVKPVRAPSSNVSPGSSQAAAAAADAGQDFSSLW
ncbi:MAG: hypothetical protein ACRDCE_08840 [Cetobacterium sp.]|uniref:hypothetical protein n=1 Tax=Cetobacterium sp. TaxID=2071632 RepID=UPI003EE6A763